MDYAVSNFMASQLFPGDGPVEQKDRLFVAKGCMCSRTYSSALKVRVPISE